MTPIIPIAPWKPYQFTTTPAIVIKGQTTVNDALFIRIVGKVNVEHLKWTIGNYWEQKLAKLDTERLYDELRILFRSKRKAKRTMNETRDEIAARVIEHDWHRIWTTFTKKIDRCLWRSATTKTAILQTVQLHMADLVIEENSKCDVTFNQTHYTVDVEGRRSVVGRLTAINKDRVRVMHIKNRFVGRTFWQCQGRSHVERHEPGLFDNAQ